MTPDVSSRIPPQTLSYLAHPSLAPLWAQARRRLERNGLAAEGAITVELDDEGVARLRGLLGAGTKGSGGRIRLDVLDAALRRSAAASGLTTVVAELTGPLVDRGAARDAVRKQWTNVWVALDAALAEAGIAEAAWVPDFVSGLRRSGLLTRAGSESAQRSVQQAGQVLGVLWRDGLFDGDATAAEPRWELAALASRYTGDAHGLDDGRLVGALVLRAAAAVWDMPVPERPAQRRDLWTRLGVTPDLVSGTVLAWSLRPPRSDPWSVMMRTRADLGLVTHLTVQELNACADVLLAAPGAAVFACENPQVLQAAARAGTTTPLLCLAGNPASAGWLAVRRLLAHNTTVHYHGDFDWPGIGIAGRLYEAGVLPWRMDADAYLRAVRTLADDRQLALSGSPVATPWDVELSTSMRRTGVAVHEESLLRTLLPDLT